MQTQNSLVLNLFGGPGVGKTSIMAEVFAKLKWADVNCEMAPEFAKEKVWEGSLEILGNQVYVFGKQHHTIMRLLGKVDVIVTDSPLLLSIIYGRTEGEAFRNLVIEKNEQLNRMNFFLMRQKQYNPSGRLQTEDQARMKDIEIKDMLNKIGESYLLLPGCPESSERIFRMVMDRLHRDEIGTT